jgi:hypothetical protein
MEGFMVYMEKPIYGKVIYDLTQTRRCCGSALLKVGIFRQFFVQVFHPECLQNL